jgi:hypothetical protein
MPQIHIYDVEKKTENHFDLEVPADHRIDLVSFINRFNLV